MSQNTTTDDDEELPEEELQFAALDERFQQFIDPVNALVDEAKLRFDHEGLRIRAVDPANVAMVDAELYHTAFTSYDVAEGVIGVHTRDIADLLERAPGPEKVRFKTVGHKKYQITIGRFQWTEGWITPDHIRMEPELPELDLPAKITLPGDHLTQIIEYADFVDRAGHVWLTVDEDRRELVAEAQDDTDDGEYRLSEDDGLVFHDIGPARSRYSIDYFRDLVEGIPEGEDVTMRLGEEFPFKLQFGIDEGQVEYMQAPRIMSSE